jgi:hypothetical protein
LGAERYIAGGKQCCHPLQRHAATSSIRQESVIHAEGAAKFSENLAISRLERSRLRGGRIRVRELSRG